MQEITKQKYFYYIAFMLLASTYLPLVFNNLPPIIRSHHLWTFIWVVSLLVFNPKPFQNRMMIYLLAYGLGLYLATKTIWSSMDDWNRTRLFSEFYEIGIGISVITYFMQNKEYLSLAKITKWSLVFLFITAIMSIISSTIDPMYAKNLVWTSTNEKETILTIRRYGGGTYSTAGAFMCLFPGLVYYYKNIRTSIISKRQIIIFSIIVFLGLLGMQIFGNILIAFIFSIMALFGMKKIRLSIMVIVIFFSMSMIIPQDKYVTVLRYISTPFKRHSELSYKFNDLANFIETGVDISDNSTGTGIRAERYPLLYRTFIKGPIFGCYFFSDQSGNGYDSAGAHLYWMNKLTITGILGLIFFLFIPYRFIKINFQYFDSKYKFYYILASLSILSYGLIKVIGGRETWYAFFIIIPGMYYLPLLKKPKKQVDESNGGRNSLNSSMQK
jgi:hypothetical protein